MPTRPGAQNSVAEAVGPRKGEFIAPPEVPDLDERSDALPAQEEFWRPPVRFGSVPVEKEPLGWDRRRGFRKLFPRVLLPFQVIERVSFGHPALEPNRLFWGDNLHVMRQLPSESIDLIYIDPPFFSGRQYNVIFGDRNELRSFSDIWEGGMPGYLIWLNARLYEMKRLLKKTGSIYVHLDWHANHYIKAEMDKIYGVENFRNEIIWKRTTGHRDSHRWNQAHDTILFYSKGNSFLWNPQYEPYDEKYIREQFRYADPDGRRYMADNLLAAGTRKGESGKPWHGIDPTTTGNHWQYTVQKLEELDAAGQIHWPKKEGGMPRLKRYLDQLDGRPATTVWSDIPAIGAHAAERIGYPTQKPEAAIERLVRASSNEGDVVGDFFCGGGTTPAVAQRLGRRWIACDQSRVAVAITADRLTRQVEEQTGKLFPVPDFTIEHWGVYESRRLAEMPADQFRAFVLRCFGAVPEEHGQDARATCGTGVPPVGTGMAVPAMNHGQDALATVSIRQGAYLPHWTLEGATYAVTFRLADALPQEVLRSWLFERENILKTAQQMGRPLSEQEEKRLHQLHSEKVERYLDAGHGACWMKDDRAAEIVAKALKHFDGERYDLLAWCVMPNHVHVVMRPREGHELPDILHSWKSFSAKEANKVLGRKGEFWQAEYYDHLIRDEKDLEHCVEYILRNPEAARLKGWKWVGGTGVPPVEGGLAVPAMNHGRDARATIHGYKGAIPVWVGQPDQKKGVTAKDVQDFANAIRKTLRYKQDNLRDGIMLAWAFRPDAVEAAERLRKLEQTELNFIRLDMIRIDSPRFREDVASLSTKHADYGNFLTFVQPPRVEVGYKRIAARTYKFDVSETAILNPGAKIINVQWDFNYGKRFSSTPGYSFIRGKDKEPALQVEYEFPAAGTFGVACKVQDDMGGEGTWTGEIEVR